MFVRIIKSYRDIIAVCDSELLGKKFEEDQFQLDIKESFFKGKKVSEKELIDLIQYMSKEDATFNIVGEKSINIALKVGIIGKDEIRKIQDVPFVLVLA